MIARTLSRLCARWPAALVAATSCLSASDVWVPAWNAFFNALKLQEGSHGHETGTSGYMCFDAVPAPLLRSIAQQWTDNALLAVTSARLAEVCPTAHASALRGVCEAVESPLSSSSPPVTPPDGLELLLATWSAHMLLSGLHASHQAPFAVSSHMIRSYSYTAPDTVSAVLADCLKKDVAPVLRYLTEFATPPASTLVSQQPHCLPSSTRALRHALVLLLSSFVATWREAPSSKAQSPPRSMILSKQEHALALELRQCIDACGGSHTTAENIVGGERRGDASAQAQSRDARGKAARLRVTSLEAATEAQLALVQAALADMMDPDDSSAASTNVDTKDPETGDGPLWRACEAWITGTGPSAPSSPFAGITQTGERESETVDVLQRVNSQLSQIARRSAVKTGSGQL
ncbi:hypothetical protein GH5_05131 [Leishmania sp. Ghana 2012 LV757]|uniref:hypothetical protein n=1 Tax=Leishmania sp. Ghana 2012 LV757 TaxID=2803181 RepID=UPI001B53A0CB|nr:hypothetical protein GH5_05131 [Leishmania sp. Ghana 2012 LV757]